MAKIHPTAVIEAGAQLGDDVEVGPYSIIGGQVKIGARTKIMAHVVVAGATTIGEGCTIFPFASVGQQTQDLKFRGGTPRVEIGNQTTLREFVTINAATNDGDATRVGSGCHIMAYAHIAHDCVVGDGVIMANCATLAGHVIVEDGATLGGLTGVHQFVRIGRMSFIGGCSKVVQDIPPFMLADGNPLQIHGLNMVGLKRRGVSEHAQEALKSAFRLIYRENLTTRAALERIEKEIEPLPEVRALTAFVRASTRGITR
jgi:UDP-N-acetylglucosamine acyltransferase